MRLLVLPSGLKEIGGDKGTSDKISILSFLLSFYKPIMLYVLVFTGVCVLFVWFSVPWKKEKK